MACDMVCVDWGVSLSKAKKELGDSKGISGNLDPSILFAPEELIRAEVRANIMASGGPGKHVLNLGHGVIQGTPEPAIGWLVDEAKNFRG